MPLALWKVSMKPLLKVLSTTWSTHKITSVKIEQAEHTQVIDSAATKLGLAANKVFLFVIHKEIQGWRNFKTIISWGLSKVGETHGPIFDEVKGRAVAVYRKGCQQETVFVQGLIKTQLTDRIDAHWKLHDQAIDWFKVQTQAFLDEAPVPVLDPPVEPDPLGDELIIPEDPAPIQVATWNKRRSGAKSKRVTLADVMKQEAAKS